MITIIGIGQTLRGDDAAGILAVQRWKDAYPSTSSHPLVRVELEELPGLSLLDLLSGAKFAIIVDATRSNFPPGHLHLLEIIDLDSFQQESASAHGWGVAETLVLGRLIRPESLPGKITLLGIEAGQLDLGEELSPTVSAALDPASALIESLVIRWLDGVD